MSDIQTDLRRQLLQGTRTSRELASGLRVSQSTISRALAALPPDHLVQIGQARVTRYGLRRVLPGLGSEWPLYLVDQSGNVDQLGNLHLLGQSECWLERRSPDLWPSLTRGSFAHGLFPGLPWFLDDARPQGFLGRSFARNYGAQLGLSSHLATWQQDDIVAALVRFGHDLPGAFVLGNDALALALQPPFIIDHREREIEYPRLAQEVLDGDIIGSSAAGEQPKFTLCVTEGPRLRQVLVKFSPPVDQPEGRRWADLLWAEKLAGDVLTEAGLPAARAEVIDAGGRRFLEVERFDRTVRGGRRPVVSLAALDAAFYGEFGTWAQAATRLKEHDWITRETAERLTLLGEFGHGIANTDMHFGNTSFLLSPQPPLSLTPVYDMLPMAYRPGLEGQLPTYPAPALVRSESAQARALAREFWTRVAGAAEVSADFRAIAAGHRVAS